MSWMAGDRKPEAEIHIHKDDGDSKIYTRDISTLLVYMCDSEYLETIFGLGKQTIDSLGDWARREQTQQMISQLEAA